MNFRNRNAHSQQRRFRHTILCLLLISIFMANLGIGQSGGTSVAFASLQQASNSLTINIFEDRNVDAVRNDIDKGVPNIAVNLFDANDAANSPCATKTSGSNGQIIFSTADTANCLGNRLRLEVDESTYPSRLFAGLVNLTDDDGNSATPTYRDAATDASAATQIVDLSAAVELNIGLVDPTASRRHVTCCCRSSWACCENVTCVWRLSRAV